MAYQDIVKADLERDEGKRMALYVDSVGVPTIGIGHNAHKPLSDRAVKTIFEDDLADAEVDARSLFPNFAQMTDARKAVLINMTFNLGRDRLSGFKNFRAAVAAYDFAWAAEEMLDSKWAIQVKERAIRLADMMRKG